MSDPQRVARPANLSAEPLLAAVGVLGGEKRLSRFPDADRAIIDPEKLRDYVLSPDHDHGRHKARVFVSALGIDRDSGSICEVRGQIASRVVAAEVSEVRTGRYGMRYSVPMLIEGLNAKRMKSRRAGSLIKDGLDH